MLSDLHISNFRGFEDLDLKNLGRVNLIVGKNNTGKTSLLEAVTLVVTLKSPGDLRQAYRAYPRATAHFDGWLVHDGAVTQEACVDASLDAQVRSCRIKIDKESVATSVPSSGTTACSAYMQSAIRQDPGLIPPFAETVRQRGGEETLEGILRAIDSRVKTVRLSTGPGPNSEPFIEVDLGLSARMPISQAGEGLNRVLTIIVQLFGSKPQFALFDEIENGIHHTVLSKVWRGIAEVAERMNVQVFATTHSHECLEAAHEAFAERESYDLRVIQLYRVDQKTEGRVLDRNLIEAAIDGEIDLPLVMGKPEIEDYKQVLFVEGDSDLQFYKTLLKKRVGLEVFIKNCQGRDQTKNALEILLKPDFLDEKTHIAVIVDADENARSAATSFQEVLGRLTGQKVIVGGWTVGQPRVGLWIAPDGQNPGEVETLVWKAWSAESGNAGTKACIELYAGCMESSGHSPKSRDKVLVNALLAVANEDDPRLGPGARAGIFDFERPEYASLLEFLRGFASDPPSAPSSPSASSIVKK